MPVRNLILFVLFAHKILDVVKDVKKNTIKNTIESIKVPTTRNKVCAKSFTIVDAMAVSLS